jgi:predicted ATPase
MPAGEPSMETAEEVSIAHMPNLIPGIEEPELYQHPNRQRLLSRILLLLAEGSIRGVAEKTKLIPLRVA